MKAVEKAVAAGMGYAGIPRLLKRFMGKHLTIIAYHHIFDEGECDRQETTNLFFVGAGAFRAHLAYLMKHYTPIGMEEMTAWVTGEGRLPDNPLLLTFDDGYRGFYRHVYPELKRLGVPALVNLITGWVDRELTPWDVLINRTVNNAFTNRLALSVRGREIVLYLDSPGKKRDAFSFLSKLYETSPADYRGGLLDSLVEAAPWIRESDGVLESLTWGEIREMSGNGIEFGCHTHSHTVLRGLNEAEVREELLRSSKRLADELSCDRPAFSYPLGKFDATALDQVSSMDFLFAMRSDGGPARRNGNVFLLPRISVRGGDRIADLVFKLSGLQSTMRRWYGMIQWNRDRNGTWAL